MLTAFIGGWSEDNILDRWQNAGLDQLQLLKLYNLDLHLNTSL